ncbi:amino acid ABC transporter permease [Alcaligenes ammonioxydans]|jgi:general L-amino acid transport system permease protein|uniref:Amino acid ABC transporter permease n=1 Tax=Alcaligenes ammonioxydans TaxID=2582914 RepID=A0ABX8SVR8_9BURK|nr:amino acid ABC transporter permease [Alcaligenes ammonioxydans]EJC62891.1 amino acid ABC transporter permease [Alcaligenes faecalis subsp. faecalis NCIB 8687]QBH19019.1 amino acid ABC transporter permease [Alcaligenes faecalis]MCH1880343.1 amino acid ABC transporter permease [Alcaligenes ammonioxydans]QXX80126.1 amino acid ABC transporter permease [Alcaligenes ammonioxydans]HRK87157.1 amino acid ABC transporter permease [Alcaligenes faecalis]
MSHTPTSTVSGPPPLQTGILGWLRQNLFSSPLNAILTVLSAWLLLLTVPATIDWLFIKANFDAQTAQDCRASAGACWAFIREKHRLILFGIYPYDEQWRPLLATILLTLLIVCSCIRWFWKPWLPLLWLAGLTVVGILMWGGVLGLSYVENSLWGGLPLTLILATFGIAFAFPLGVLLALGRTSRLPAVKAVCVVYIELIRGVPLISLLFMSSVMLPLFMPEGFNIDKLLRAQIAIILFAAAYIAETVRGGLQAIPKGQYEGAASLGLSYWRTMRQIILPQALKIVIPPLVGIFISLFKDTSLVVIIGIFDLTQAAKVALADSAWRGFSREAYLFIALIYFVFCYSISRYSRSLERRLQTGYER